jgi:hypothetical protein
VDSGASDNFIDTTFVKINGIRTQPKAIPEPLTLVDGGLCRGGDINDQVQMKVQVDGFERKTSPSKQLSWDHIPSYSASPDYGKTAR